MVFAPVENFQKADELFGTVTANYCLPFDSNLKIYFMKYEYFIQAAQHFSH
jgi:hypothetical protein